MAFAVIVGAGAAGLMAARELSRAGKTVVILEARDRTGGRILPLAEDTFDYPAQAGAEFIHGEALVTKALIAEAGFRLTTSHGEMWRAEGGSLVKSNFIEPRPELLRRLKALKKDVPITVFLLRYFSARKYDALRTEVIRMVEGYDAADASKASSFAYRDEIAGSDWEQAGLQEGYGALVAFLESECRTLGVVINCEAEVTALDSSGSTVQVHCRDGREFSADYAIVTTPLPLLQVLKFKPKATKHLAAAAKIGYGDAMKILIQFKTPWWMKIENGKFQKMSFVLSHEPVPTWWTRYPVIRPLLAGWIAGPRARKLSQLSDAKVTEKALSSLSRIFGVTKEMLEGQLVTTTVANWPRDPFARGAYSYVTPKTVIARKTLEKPINGRIFIAGEAIYDGKVAGTVEAALSSGKTVAKKLLKEIV